MTTLRELRALLALFFPVVAFALLFWRDLHPGALSWELIAMITLGTVATAAGVLDWRLHRSGVSVGLPEHRAHFQALCAGGLLFTLMAAATARPHPWLLLPIIATAMWTCALICWDEFVHHRRRRCGPYETALHRTLVFGHAGAFLIWVHLCFVRPYLGG